MYTKPSMMVCLTYPSLHRHMHPTLGLPSNPPVGFSTMVPSLRSLYVVHTHSLVSSPSSGFPRASASQGVLQDESRPSSSEHSESLKPGLQLSEVVGVHSWQPSVTPALAK